MSIDNMRNNAAKIALENNCDYLMFIDDDVIIRPDTLDSLLEADKDIIMALTFVRGWPFPPMFFKASENLTTDKRKETLIFYEDYVPDEHGLVKCAAVGFSCTLLKMDVVKAINPPYFITGPHHTEDVYFCLKARYSLDPEPSIFVDTRVPTMHMMMSDGVSDINVGKLRELYRPEEPIGRTRLERISDSLKLLEYVEA